MSEAFKEEEGRIGGSPKEGTLSHAGKSGETVSSEIKGEEPEHKELESRAADEDGSRKQESENPALQEGEAGQKAEASSPNYSWVNPKLQGRQAADRTGGGPAGSAYGQGQNPWRTPNASGTYWTGTGHQGQGGSANPHFEQSQSRGQQGGPGNYGQYQTHPNYGSYPGGQNFDPNDPARRAAEKAARKAQKKSEKKAAREARRKSGRRGWMSTVAMGLVFGLVAGSVAYGVNYVGNRIHPVYRALPDGEGTDPELSIKETVVGSSGEGEKAGNRSAAPGSEGRDLTVEEIAANAMPSVVTISTMSVMEMQSFFGGTQQYTVEGAGTGIIVGQNEDELLIATNNHVIEGATQVSIGFTDESVAEATIKGTEASDDLAVVAVKLSDIDEKTREVIKIAKIGVSDELALGQQVVAIGNALGIGQSVTSGYISALDRELELSDGQTSFKSSNLIQTDAAINSGNSGGALLNMRGELIGINEAKSSSSEGASVDNIGYAIPISKAMPILENLMKMETREQVDEKEMGYLGITCANDEIASQMSSTYGMPEGVIVTSVVKDGPSEKGGVKKGDVIVKIAGLDVSTFTELQNELRYHKSGEEVEIEVKRADDGDYRSVTLQVKLTTSDILKKISSQSSSEDQE